jgi:hypothetical protein
MEATGAEASRNHHGFARDQAQVTDWVFSDGFAKGADT